jgi:hypothetical protein
MLDNLDEHPDVREITTGTIPQAVSVIRQITPGDDSSHRLMILRRARTLESYGKEPEARLRRLANPDPPPSSPYHRKTLPGMDQLTSAERNAAKDLTTLRPHEAQFVMAMPSTTKNHPPRSDPHRNRRPSPTRHYQRSESPTLQQIEPNENRNPIPKPPSRASPRQPYRRPQADPTVCPAGSQNSSLHPAPPRGPGAVTLCDRHRPWCRRLLHAQQVTNPNPNNPDP